MAGMTEFCKAAITRGIGQHGGQAGVADASRFGPAASALVPTALASTV